MKKFFSKFITKPSDIWSIPNLLVYFRFALVVVFIIIYFTPIRIGEDEIQRYIASGIVLLAGFTDFLDGQIARRCNMVTELGKALDPTADKVMQLAIAVCLSITYHSYPTFFVMLAIFLAKELTLLIFNIILFGQGKKLGGAMWFGKVSTFVFYVAMGVLLLLPNIDEPAIYSTTIITTVFLSISYICYFPVLIKLLKSPIKNVGVKSEDVEQDNETKTEIGNKQS